MTLSKLDKRCQACPDRDFCNNKQMCACAVYVPKEIKFDGTLLQQEDIVKTMLKNMSKIGGLNNGNKM